MTNNVWGQEKTNIAIANTEDSIPLFRNISVSFDLVGLAQMAFGDYGQYEGGLRVNLKDKYFPVVEVGLGKANAKDDATRLSYKTQAPYFRVGCDINVMKNKHDINRLYGGLRYGWVEFVFGVDAKIWGPIRLGWTARYKRRLFHNDGDVGNTWYVPGYGKEGNTRLGGTFNVTIEL